MAQPTPAGAPAKDPADSADLSPAADLALIFAISVALLIPCIWQQHIQAGDLASHVYNAWLAGEVQRGAAPGLTLAHPFTNVLSDWALQAMLHAAGPEWAERIVAGCSVLIFFWGAFAFVSTFAGRRPWLLGPSIGLLAYGLVFHLGFLNFYLSTGLCLWMMALLWRPSRARVAIAAALAVAAVLAHAMPVAWAAGVLLYAWLARALPPNLKPLLFLGAIGALAAFQAVLMKLVPFRWSIGQTLSLSGVLGLTGTEQFFLFSPQYLLVAAGILLVWCALLFERIDRGKFLSDPLVHLWLIELAAYVLMPEAIQLPRYRHVLAYIPQRLSLFNAILLLAVVARCRHGRGITRFSAALATMYFTFLFIDVRAYNAIENRIAELAATVPAGARFAAEISDSNSRLSPLLHAPDRACIGHCFSYANYEPATAQFRIRLAGPSPVAAPDMSVVQEIEEGRHIVTAAEDPIYSVCRCPGAPSSMCVRRIGQGEKTCSFSLAISGSLWSGPQPGAP